MASSTTFGSRRVGFWSRCLLICAGSRRPPRAWRAYLRAARPSLISAPARASGRAVARRQLRQLEGGRREPPVVGLADLRHGVAGLGREAVARHPKQGLVARGIECGERGAVAALDIALGRLGQLPAHLGEHRIDRRRRGRLLGGGRRGWRGLLGCRRRCRRGGGLAVAVRREAVARSLAAELWAARVVARQALPAAETGTEEWRRSLPVRAAGCCGAALDGSAAGPAGGVCAKTGAPAVSASTSGAARTAEVAQPVRLNIRESLQLARKPTGRWIA